jgi:hypothetical protein
MNPPDCLKARLRASGAAASFNRMRGFTGVFATGAGTRRVAGSLALAVLTSGVLAGCSGTAKKSTTGEFSPQAVEKEEVAAIKGEESAEYQKDRELLSVLEAKKREEAAEASARHTLATANAKAKRRELAAEKAAKRREKEASEASAKKVAAKKRSATPPASTRKPAPVKRKPSTTPTESAPPTVTVPSGGN